MDVTVTMTVTVMKKIRREDRAKVHVADSNK